MFLSAIHSTNAVCCTRVLGQSSIRAGCISTLTEAIHIADQLNHHGIWFRGQSDYRWELRPSIFRDRYHEVDILTEFWSQYCVKSITHKNTFELLSLMHHYSTPTRLLNWSESVLTALYFSVSDAEDGDQKSGSLFALDTRILNQKSKFKGMEFTKHRNGIPLYNDLSVILRALFSSSSTFLEFRRKVEKISSKNFLEENKTKIVMPIAVMPKPLHSRIKNQNSVFTLHGGTVFFDDDPARLMPLSLQQLNNQNGEKFLKKYEVINRSELKKQLKKLIHEGSLYIDPYYFGGYLKEKWKLIPQHEGSVASNF